jgi:hypothetical protein
MATNLSDEFLASLLPELYALLHCWAADGSLVGAAQEALLLKRTPEALEELAAQWAKGDFSGLPPIVLLSSADISGALGAYAISTGTIYLNADWLAGASQEQVNAVLTEELGHHLDGLLNEVDTLGDEGEVFEALLSGDGVLGAQQRDRMLEENDQGSIVVKGEVLVVEQASVPSTPIPSASPGPMAVGMNLENIVDWSPAWTFTDAFQASRPWISHAFNTQTWATSWDPAVSPLLDLDANGNVRSLQSWTAAGVPMRQFAGTLMFRDLGGGYPAGTYQAEWDGTGVVSFGFDAVVVASGRTAAGRNFATLQVSPTDAGIYMRIEDTSAADPVRNFHVWMPDTNGHTFHPLFLERLAPFGTLRFMGMQETNTSDIQTWADRRDSLDIRQGSGPEGTPSEPLVNGASLEVMVALANALDADPWFNMPHQADDTFVRNFATYVRQHLEPGRKVYVEWANEVWNFGFGFEASSWVANRAAAAGLDPNLGQWIVAGQEAKRDMDIWSEVFAGQTNHQLVRVAAGWAAVDWVTNEIATHMGGSFDAIAMAPYITPTDAQRASYSVSTTEDQVLADTRVNIANALEWVRNHHQLATNWATTLGRPIQLLAYEGGAHLDGRNAPYQGAFHGASNDPRMGDIYTEYLRGLEASGLDLYVDFQFTGSSTPAPWGDFAKLHRMDEPLATAYRYNAVAAAANALPAFPGAEGFGAMATGGRGGQVIYVTTTAASGPGSLQWAIDQPGAKTILFKVSGLIDARIHLRNGDVTIAGHTSPGGITVRGFVTDETPFQDQLVSPPADFAENWILQHIRIRPGLNGPSDDGLRLRYTRNAIVDHVSIANATDEAVEISYSNNITIQNSMLAETLGGHSFYGGMLMNYSNPTHGFALDNLSIHHNIFNRIEGRLPEASRESLAAANSTMNLELSSNLYWDPEFFIALGANTGQLTDPTGTPYPIHYRLNAVNNYFQANPAFSYGMWDDQILRETSAPLNALHLSGNRMNLYPTRSDYELFYCCNDYPLELNPDPTSRLAQNSTTRHPFPSITYTPALDLASVLPNRVGAWPRDPIDTRLLLPIRENRFDPASSSTNPYGDAYFTTYLGSAPPPPVDTDSDGMPDDWESTKGLNPGVADHNGIQLSTVGYTNLEVYLHELADRLTSSPILPVITLGVSPASVAEDGATNLIYTFTRTGSTSAPLDVNYSVAGTASVGTDYTGIAATPSTKTVTFSAGSGTATVTVDPIANTEIETDETVALTLASGTGYTIGTAGAVTGTIANDDFALPSINLAVSPASVLENGATNLIYTFTRTAPTTNALTVNYSIAGTAVTGDYTGATPGTGKTITFAANSATATLTIDPTPDSTVESNETVALTLASGTGYTIGTAGAVTGTITNDDIIGTANADTLTGTTKAEFIDGLAGRDILTGGSGPDVFGFRFTQSTVTAPDRITDFQFGSDKIDLFSSTGSALATPPAFSRAANNSIATTLSALATAVYTDANGLSVGNQALAANAAAVVTATNTAIAGTYLLMNDGTASLNTTNDLMINITGFSGTLPAFGIIISNSVFV